MNEKTATVTCLRCSHAARNVRADGSKVGPGVFLLSAVWCQARHHALRIASLVTLVSVLYASEARAVSIGLFASVGPAASSVDVVQPGKVFDESLAAGLIILSLGGADLFGLMEYRVDGNFDPFFAARFAITNATDDPQSLGASIRFPMAPVLTSSPLPTFTGLFTVELMDADGDGSASYTGGGAGFALFEPVLGASLTSPHSVLLTEPGLTVIYNIGGQAVPVSPRTGQWDGMNFVHLAGGALSPRDRVEFYVFGCVALPGASCPAPPELSLAPPQPIPEPSTVSLLALAIIALAARQALRAKAAPR